MAEFIRRLRHTESGKRGLDYNSDTVSLWRRDLPDGRMDFHVWKAIRSDRENEVWELEVRPSKDRGAVLGLPVAETGGASDFPPDDVIAGLIDALTQDQIYEAFRLAPSAGEEQPDDESGDRPPAGMLPWPPPVGGYSREQLDAARAADPNRNY